MEADRPSGQRQRLDRQLLLAFNTATESYRRAIATTEETLRRYEDLPIGHPDGNLARRTAAANELRALQRCREALRAYSDLLGSDRSTSGVQKASEAIRDVLTPREIEVLVLIAQGLSSKHISHELGISFKTAICHRSHIMDKLEIHNVTGLVRYAIREKLIAP
jgi:DNA-binding CsgD family transcriptional regulator